MTTGEAALTDGTYYNPTGIPVGNEFFMYVQGSNFNGGPAAPGEPDCPGDKILLFKAPYSTAGMVGTFQFVRRVSPCPSLNDPGGPSHHYYGPGQVFYDGQYRIVADSSDAETFDALILDTSNDGVNWTWQDFLNSATSDVYAPVLVASEDRQIYCNPGCHSHQTWWGYLPFDYGTGRIKVDVSTQYPRGFRIHVLSGGQWVQVDDATGNFSFVPDDVWPGVFARTLMWNVDHWEVWGYKNVSPNGCSPCDGSYNNYGAGSTFEFREAYTGGDLAPTQAVFSNIRCMPSDHAVGRLFPFRVNDPAGRRFLYSATNDANICQPLWSPYQGMYVVITEVSN